jgi:ABC-type glycerol-3-phosphate transport system substrate-binding protein
MKKTLILVSVLALTLSGCGKKAKEPSPSPSPATPASSAPQSASPSPSPSPSPSESPTLKESSENQPTAKDLEKLINEANSTQDEEKRKELLGEIQTILEEAEKKAEK